MLLSGPATNDFVVAHVALMRSGLVGIPVNSAYTARELEVLVLVAEGRTNADIGRALHISEATVKTHLLRIFAKLDVADRTAAVTTAMSYGLL